jgi:SAM-dependent methyltransferase
MTDTSHQAAAIEVPPLRDELREVVGHALSATYTSVSKDGIQTGNHYQSILLGDQRTAGFRGHRAEFFDQLAFEGKRVLDLGSNLGEASREIRLRGAALVDGYEADQFFLDTALAINAYNRASRVSFFLRDITDPASYEEVFDVVVALSVFTYVRRVLPAIARITSCFVLETHALEDNLESHYLRPVAEFFPHYTILGESDWGRPFEGSGHRAVIAFAKDGMHLANLVRPRPVS